MLPPVRRKVHTGLQRYQENESRKWTPEKQNDPPPEDDRDMEDHDPLVRLSHLLSSRTPNVLFVLQEIGVEGNPMTGRQRQKGGP